MTASQANIEAIFPVTPVQDGILFHTLYAPDSPLYIQQYTALLDGALDVDLFKVAWQRVVDRHAALRTFLVWQGRERPLQIVRRSATPDWAEHDWRGATAETQADQLEAFLEEDRLQGFVLDRAPLMRCALLRTGDRSYRFVWTHHHVVIDGWSIGIVLSEVFSIYEALVAGRQASLPPAAAYRNYIAWLQDAGDSGAEEFWSKRLEGFSTPTSLRIEAAAGDSPWAANQAEERVELTLPATKRLTERARSHGLTLNTMLRAAWAIVLSRYSGEGDVLFGATVSGRPPELDGALDMVGMFINTLPVRTRVEEGEALVDWLHRLQRDQVVATPYESTPLVDVQRWSGVVKGEPLFQTVLVLENVPEPHTGASDLRTLDVQYLQRSNYPIAVLAMPGPPLQLNFLYDVDRFDHRTIERLARQLRHVMESMADDLALPVGDVPLMPDEELAEIVGEWNATGAEYPSKQTVDQLIDEVVSAAPEHPAVIGDGITMSYGELDAKASLLAARLRGLGVGPEARVAVAMDRSPGMVVGILGVLKAGGAYVPVDPALPPERISYVVADASAVAVVVDAGQAARSVALAPPIPQVAVGNAGDLSDGDASSPAVPPADSATPENAAYVLYTSGSTGRPKGVVVTHRNLVNSTTARLRAYGDPVGRFLLLSPVFFDSSVAGLFSSLTQGGTLVLPAPDMEKDVRHLAALIEQHQVTHTLALPTLYGLVLDHAEAESLGSLQLVMVAGEACAPAIVRRHHEMLPGAKLVNEYGPTEATVWCTFHEVDAGEAGRPDARRVPIGRPIANTQAYILDDAGKPVPVGVPGELCTAGLGLAREYLGKPELTAELFPTRHVPGVGLVRLYRTGDVARYLPDGTIDLLGRLDHQVKIRGQRIELGEIESLLVEHPAVRDAVVVAREDASAGPDAAALALVAFAESEATPDVLRSFLAARLPNVMVPPVVVPLSAMPRGATGKVDRGALPEVGWIVDEERSHIAPSGAIEEALAAIWEAVLGVEAVGAADNFFDLGGDSIASIRIIARAHEAGLSISPRDFFDHPTIAELAGIAQVATRDS